MSILKRDKTKQPERYIIAGSGGAAADSAVEGRPHGDHRSDAPHSRPIAALGENEKPDQLAEKQQYSEDRQEALLDEGLEESFPSSDPVSVKRIT
ncbi:hypothetical protein [Phenylobacterium sp. Root700]|uniref:hypothetical protein n=1 Tax=Phenylobacterium sp. Root700 TaxID=1736591 RepID=UPI000ADBBFDE|nr:hypothetical protein [Phenylobacterium sp. Root700]